MTRVLVCGGRDFGEAPIWAHSGHEASIRANKEVRLLHTTLDALHVDRRISLVIDGSARGADRHAYHWACRMALPVMRFRADWITHSKAAGPIRNQQMLDEGKPDLVVAFPGGSGTADMVRRARAAGVEVMEVAP